MSRTGKAYLKIEVDGLGKLLAMCEELGDKEKVEAEFKDAAASAARRVVERTQALAVGMGHGGTIKAAHSLSVDAGPTSAAVVVDPAQFAGIVGGLFGAHHDRPRKRSPHRETYYYRGKPKQRTVSDTYKGFNQFPSPPMRPPLPWVAFASERDEIEADFLKAVLGIVDKYTTTTEGA